jgi:transcriptional regulator GlxA family with amidase domain
MAKRGFDLPQTKIPPLAVIAIREAARKREAMRKEITERYSNEALAQQWGVHKRTIEKILSYETAKHIL